VLVLGDQAREFLEGLHLDRPGTSLLPSNEIPAEAWGRLIKRLLPDQKVIHTLTLEEELPTSLQDLQMALNAEGKQLLVHRPKAKEATTEALSRVIEDESTFFLPPEADLVNRKVLLFLLKASHDKKVALLAFSKVLVDAGALAALEVTPEDLGVRSAMLALGEEPKAPVVLVHLNEKRAQFLGIQPEADLISGSPLEN
jgi:ABC-type uncharacterized transport system substrate-binding protein